MERPAPEGSAFTAALEPVRAMLKQKSGRAAIAEAMALLARTRSDLYWVGVYILRGDELLVGPYVGPTTDHVRIPIGRGVCGTAVAEDRNQLVDDVSALDNYLACNLLTKSEIVVLIRNEQGKILGQIDIDSTRLKAFSKADEAALEELGVMLAPHMHGALVT